MTRFRTPSNELNDARARPTSQSTPRSNAARLVLSDSSLYAALTRLNLDADPGFTSGCVDRASRRYASFISSVDAPEPTPSSS